jgi:hypothetical protein
MEINLHPRNGFNTEGTQFQKALNQSISSASFPEDYEL